MYSFLFFCQFRIKMARLQIRMPSAWTHFTEWFNNLKKMSEYVTQIL